MQQLHRLRDLKGYCLNATDGEIGHLQEAYFDDASWRVRYFVVRTGGWLLGRDVLVAPRSVTGVDEQHQCLEVNVTRDKIKGSPPVGAEKPVSRHYEEEFFRYYEWERYWITETLTGVPAPPASAAQVQSHRLPAKPDQPGLRSSDEVSGYSIHASDGQVGNVADLIIEDGDWSVRYLEVDTRAWLPGKHVLVAPAWIREVSWSGHRVSVDLRSESIRTAPPYDPLKLITPDDELRLYSHYGKAVE